MPDRSEKAQQAADWLRASVAGEFAIHDIDWTDDDVDLPADRPCHLCGKNPAEGLASVWTQATGERWYCHGDDDELSCYEATSIEPTLPAPIAFYLRTPSGSPTSSERPGGK